MYAECASIVDGAVAWRRTADSAGDVRVLPDGCMDLIWVGGKLLVAGPDTSAHLVRDELGVSYVGLRFAPGTGPAVFGVPAHELTDQRVPLSALWPESAVRLLAEQVAGAESKVGVLEHLAVDRLRAAPAPSVDYRAMVDVLRSSGSVVAASAAAGFSSRQLQRLCLAAFGYGPKTLARVLRMNDALDLAREGVPLATVAMTVGYADQTHMAHDVRGLTGVPMRAILTTA
jgi:AraC-like DNA-binding protein